MDQADLEQQYIQTQLTCSVCQRKFSRIDHLLRHSRSHSGFKPYRCEDCNKDFSRLDLYKRHVSRYHPQSRSIKSSLAQIAVSERANGASSRPQTDLILSEVKESLLGANSLSFAASQEGAEEGHTLDNRNMLGPNTSSRLRNNETYSCSQNATIITGIEPDRDTEEIYPNDLTSAQNLMRSIMPDFFTSNNSTTLENEAPGVISQWDVFDYSLSTSSITNFREPDANHDDQNSDTERYGRTGGDHNAAFVTASEAFKKSPWLWQPDYGQRGGVRTKEIKSSLSQSIPLIQASLDHSIKPFDNDVQKSIVNLVVKSSHQSTMPFLQRALTPALSATLVTSFLKAHEEQAMPWIHLSCPELEGLLPELLLALIAGGAALSHEPKIRSLASVLYEPLRAATAALFERDNQNIRSLQPLQTFAIMLDIGLWSGDSRHMEISESFAHSLNTMMRRGGHFRTSSTLYAHYPRHGDDTETLQLKWQRWVAAESMKRLSMHLMVRDTQSSVCFLTAPLLSQNEIALDAPARIELWTARDAQAWAQCWYSLLLFERSPPAAVSLRDLLDDPSQLVVCHGQIDARACTRLILCNSWSKIRQYLEMKKKADSMRSLLNHNATLVTCTMLTEIEQYLSYFKLCLAEIPTYLNNDTQLLSNHQNMALYAPMEDIQILAGKHGEKEARAVLDLMRTWAKSREARQALWHGGQVMRYAKLVKPGCLSSYEAVATYQASVVFWSYALLASTTPADRSLALAHGQDAIHIDGDEGIEIHRFIALGRGLPAITLDRHIFPNEAHELVTLGCTKTMMRAVATILLYGAGGGQDQCCSTLVQKLNHLICTLGLVAESRAAM